MSDEAVITRIKKTRKERRLTQQELADKIGASLITVNRWEKGERTPNISMLQKIATALDVSVAYLMGEEESPAPAVLPVKETHAKSANMAVMTLENGCKVEAPATPEGYAFLKELFAMSMGEQIQAIANLAGKNPPPQTDTWITPLGRTSPAVNQ